MLLIYLYTFLQKTSTEGEWSVTVAEFVRHNDQVLVEASSKVLTHYQEELLPISSFMEFCDVVGKWNHYIIEDSHKQIVIISDILKEQIDTATVFH